MANASQRKPKSPLAELRSEVNKLKDDILDLGKQLGLTEKDNGNLRRFNQILLEKLKKANERDQSLQVFHLNQELKKGKDLFLLAAQKTVSKKRYCAVLEEHFAKLMKTNLEMKADDEAVKIDSGIDILEGLKRQLEEENEHLKRSIANIVQNENDMKKEIEKLKKESEEQQAQATVKSFSDHVIIDSLQEIIEEREDASKKQILNLEKELQSAQKKIEMQNQHIFEIKQLMFLAELKTKEHQKIVEEQNLRSLDEQEKSRVLENHANLLEKEATGIQERLRVMEFALAKSEENFEETKSKMEEMSRELNGWKLKAESAEVQCNSMADKTTSVMADNEKLERKVGQKVRMHMEHLVSMNFEISSLQKEKQDLAEEVTALKIMNENLEQQVGAMKQKDERDKTAMNDLQGRNEELHEAIDELRQKISKLSNKPWWRRVVSCR